MLENFLVNHIANVCDVCFGRQPNWRFRVVINGLQYVLLLFLEELWHFGVHEAGSIKHEVWWNLLRLVDVDSAEVDDSLRSIIVLTFGDIFDQSLIPVSDKVFAGFDSRLLFEQEIPEKFVDFVCRLDLEHELQRFIADLAENLLDPLRRLQFFGWRLLDCVTHYVNAPSAIIVLITCHGWHHLPQFIFSRRVHDLLA